MIKIQPGQFIIVRLDEKGERIPLSISGWDAEAGTLRLIIQAIGYTTHKMIALEVGDSILDVVGPLGRKTHLPEGGIDLNEEMAEIEKDLIKKALKQTAGSKSKAAKLLHVSLDSLRYRIEKLDL